MSSMKSFSEIRMKNMTVTVGIYHGAIVATVGHGRQLWKIRNDANYLFSIAWFN
jgi:hypothetical protein